jgi:cytochrome P450
VSSPFHDIATEAAGSAGHQRAIEGMLRVMGRLTEELAKRRGDPQEDMLSYLAFADMDDRPPSEQEIIKIGFLLLVGGLKTSTSLLSHAFAWLSDHPEAARRLLDDPELLRTATEEFLRWASPVPAMARTVTKETELGGQKLCPGDRLLISSLSANHDENVFDDPEDVRLDRWPNHHQAFGLGIHRCLGSTSGECCFRRCSSPPCDGCPISKLTWRPPNRSQRPRPVKLDQGLRESICP